MAKKTVKKKTVSSNPTRKSVSDARRGTSKGSQRPSLEWQKYLANERAVSADAKRRSRATTAEMKRENNLSRRKKK